MGFPATRPAPAPIDLIVSGQRHPATCSVCGRRPDGFGYTPRSNMPIAWACMEHLPQAKAAYHMPHHRLDEFEKRALRHAGDEAGAYLDSIGITDLALLSQEQFVTFTKTVIVAFGEEMRNQIDKDGAPF